MELSAKARQHRGVELAFARSLRIFWVFAAVLAVACGGPSPARYAGWEPMPLAIPAIGRFDDAWQRLTESRDLWRQWRKGGFDFHVQGVPYPYEGHVYSYVRARQISQTRVEFTLFVVDSERGQASERVRVRALVSAAPAHLDASRSTATLARMHSEWVERDSALGSHAEAAPARTIDELYDDCARLLILHRELQPRLYFHPNGVLMQCGFSHQECNTCLEISIQSFSHYSFDWEWRRGDPATWVCTTPWGAFPPGSQVPELSMTDLCTASFPLAPRSRIPPTEDGGLQDICEIDPAACPQMLAHTDGLAYWSYVPVPCAGGPERLPDTLEVGKVTPLSTWRFPFYSGGNDTECGSSLRRVEHRVSPILTPQ